MEDTKKGSNLSEREEFYHSQINILNNNSTNNMSIGSISNINPIIKEEDGYHYLCPKCHKFPFIEFTESIKEIKFSCSCNNKKLKQISIKDLFDKEKQYITINRLSNSYLLSLTIKVENNYEGLKCIKHNKTFLYCCIRCNVNMCPDCKIKIKEHKEHETYKKESHDSDKELFLDVIKEEDDENEEKEEKESQEEDDFSEDDKEDEDDYNREIKDHNKFIKEKHLLIELKSIELDNEKLNRIITIINSNNINNLDINENKQNIKLFKIDDNTFEKITEEEENNFKKFIRIIINDYKNYPNMSHFCNIQNIFYFFDLHYNKGNIGNLSSNENIESKEIIIEYINNDSILNLFNEKFVKSNEDKFYLEIKGQKYELMSQHEFKSEEKKITIKLILKEKTSEINMSEIFADCNRLISINGISKLKEIKIKSHYKMFYNCTSLISIPDIKDWNISNNISWMFSGCKSLSSLPDISKWNTNNVINMSYMFDGCESLSSLPDISKWDTNNVTNLSNMLYGCISLSSLPDISKWDTNNVTNLSNMFYGCISLSSLPDISKWNTNNVTDMSYMFYGCISLSSLPDISKWL